MGKKIVNQYHPETVTPPGYTLQEALEERGIAYDPFAAQLGIETEYLVALFDGLADLTPEIAEGLEKALGISARFWLKRERRYRESLERVKQPEAHEP